MRTLPLVFIDYFSRVFFDKVEEVFESTSAQNTGGADSYILADNSLRSILSGLGISDKSTSPAQDDKKYLILILGSLFDVRLGHFFEILLNRKQPDKLAVVYIEEGRFARTEDKPDRARRLFEAAVAAAEKAQNKALAGEAMSQIAQNMIDEANLLDGDETTKIQAPPKYKEAAEKFKESSKKFQEAEEFSKEGDERLNEFKARLRSQDIEGANESFRRCIAAYDKAAKKERASEKEISLAYSKKGTALRYAGTLYDQRKQYDKAVEIFEAASAAFDLGKEYTSSCETLSLQAESLTKAGRLKDAVVTLERISKKYDGIGDTRMVLQYAWRLGDAALSAGMTDKAVYAYGMAIQAAETLGDRKTADIVSHHQTIAEKGLTTDLAVPTDDGDSRIEIMRNVPISDELVKRAVQGDTESLKELISLIARIVGRPPQQIVVDIVNGEKQFRQICDILHKKGVNLLGEGLRTALRMIGLQFEVTTEMGRPEQGQEAKAATQPGAVEVVVATVTSEPRQGGVTVVVNQDDEPPFVNVDESEPTQPTASYLTVDEELTKLAKEASLGNLESVRAFLERLNHLRQQHGLQDITNLQELVSALGEQSSSLYKETRLMLGDDFTQRDFVNLRTSLRMARARRGGKGKDKDGESLDEFLKKK